MNNYINNLIIYGLKGQICLIFAFWYISQCHNTRTSKDRA